MRALVLDPGLAVSRNRPWRIELSELDDPAPPAPGWTVVIPALAGISPRAVAAAHGDASVTPPFAAPHVPGHEVIGVVAHAHRTRWAAPGHRVLVEPWLSCRHKGLPSCPRCQAGEPQLCDNRDRSGPVCGGRGVGAGTVGGGWSEALLVHEEMLVPADGIPDHRGVIAEPAAQALHAALRWERHGDRVAVIGRGVLSRLIVAALRRLHTDLDITVVWDARAAGERRGRRARALPEGTAPDVAAVTRGYLEMGADRLLRGSQHEVLDAIATQVGARRLRVSESLPVLDRGLDAVFDCRGSAASMQLGTRLLRRGGTAVLAAAAESGGLDWPLLWRREISLLPASAAGRESNGWRTFAAVREWLADPAFPADSLVTHRFPLDEYAAALQTAATGAASAAVRVVFEGPASLLRERETDEEAAGEPESEALLLSGVRQQVRDRHQFEDEPSA